MSFGQHRPIAFGSRMARLNLLATTKGVLIIANSDHYSFTSHVVETEEA